MGQNPVTKLDKVVYNLKKNYMNWITKFIKPKIKSLFEKIFKDRGKSLDNMWMQKLIYKEDMEDNQRFVKMWGAS